MPKQDRMGNLLFITGKGIKEEMAQYFSPDPDNNGEIIFDFNKVIPVEDIENEQECLEKWGTIRNSSDTQFHAVGEEKPRNLRPLKLIKSIPTPKNIKKIKTKKDR